MTAETERLDVDTLHWVIGKMKGLGQDFRLKSMQATDNSVKNTMITVSGTLISFANALTSEVKKQEEINALEGEGREIAHEEGKHAVGEDQVGEDRECSPETVW